MTTRQLREAQRIANDMASGQLINGRNEHIALLRPSSSLLQSTSWTETEAEERANDSAEHENIFQTFTFI